MVPTLGWHILSKCDRSINRHNDVEEHEYCRFPSCHLYANVESWLRSISTGMASSKKEVTGQTDLLVSLSALSLLEIPFCIISKFQIKQAHFGIIHMIVGPHHDYL